MGVAVANGVTTVNSFVGAQMQLPDWGLTVHFPGAGPGAWNCVGQEDAEIILMSFTGTDYYVVKQDFVGVEGEIEVTLYDEDVVKGTFSGTLGRWESTQDPEEDPPAETVTITDGVFMHAGSRF